METNSFNSLQEFDMCLAVSEKAVNSGLKTAWKAWKKTKQLKDTLQLRLASSGTEAAIEGMDVQLAAPVISLQVENGSSRQVKVTLTIESGKVLYNSGKAQKEEPVKNWRFSFITELGKRKIDWNALKAADPESYDDARAIVDKAKAKNPELSDSLFSLEYLFLELTHIDLLKIKNNDVQIPDTANELAVTVARKALNDLMKGELMNKEFMLGTVVRRTPTYSIPTFVMTDYVININRNPEAPTLDYLGMFSGHPLPNGMEWVLGTMKNPWIQKEALGGTEGTLAGVMVIRKDVFMGDYFAGCFHNAMRKSPLMTDLAYTTRNNPYISKEGYSWEYPVSNFNRDVPLRGAALEMIFGKVRDVPVIGSVVGWAMDALKIFPDIVVWEHRDTAWRIRFTPVPGTNKINFSGQIFTNMITTLNLNMKIPIKGTINAEIGSYILSGESSFNGTIVLDEENAILSEDDPLLQQFKIKPRVDGKINFNEFRITKNDVSGLISIEELLQKVIKELGHKSSTMTEILADEQKRLANVIGEFIEQLINGLDFEMNNHAFIPPGGAVFVYKRPHFSTYGDLFINAIYETPEV